MQIDFHYYATYCAAFLAGYSHAESVQIAAAAQYVDCCTKTALKKMNAPPEAATTQTQMEMMDTTPSILNLQDITRIWASFHFLPGDLYAKKPDCSKRYMDRYRLICKPNSPLLLDTLRLAKKIGTLQAVGVSMHILADTWAHRNFAGTPSMVINNIAGDVYELRENDSETVLQKVEFRHKVGGHDDLRAGKYTATLVQFNEWSVMNLGHGRIGHLPDYSFIRYRYLPAWGDYREILKDNPKEYMQAFVQMIYAMKWLRGDFAELSLDTYDWSAAAPYRDKIEAILTRRQLLASDGWQALGQALSGQAIPPFRETDYEQEYLAAENSQKSETAPGRFISAAVSQKRMVTEKIFASGNLLAGLPVGSFAKRTGGLKRFWQTIKRRKGGNNGL